MTAVGAVLLGVAIAGVMSSAVYLALAVVGVASFRKQAAQQASRALAEAKVGLPAVSILKPLHGAEIQLKRNLESFFEQDYEGTFEIILAVDHENDTALPIAREVCKKFVHIRSLILITGEPLWPNPPAHAFSRMAEAAQYGVLVTSDSDVEVDKNYLSSVVPPLCENTIGMVTCIYRGVNAGGFWSSLDAIGMSVEMTAGVLVANLLEGMKFGLGPTIALRRDALDSIGGFEALGSYFSNDFVIGNMIANQGFDVVLSKYVVSHVVPPMNFRKMWQRQVRWATGTKHSRPKGHLGTVFVFAIPYGLLALLGGILFHESLLGLALFGITVANRLIENYLIGWGVTRDRACFEKPWLYLLRDLLGFAVWAASYLSRNMHWRDGRFELVEGGRIRVRDRVVLEPE